VTAQASANFDCFASPLLRWLWSGLGLDCDRRRQMQSHCPCFTIPDLAVLIGIAERSIERNIQNLRNEGRLRRIGPANGGHWEILE
jgi:hypothetical protein